MNAERSGLSTDRILMFKSQHTKSLPFMCSVI